MAKPILSVDYLRSVLNYEPETGKFTWIKVIGKKTKIGCVAGFVNERGYVMIGLAKAQYFAHRLAWLYVHGTEPTVEIDHINGDKQDNRLSNLRDVLHRINCQNHRKASKNNATGLLGVMKMPNGNYSSCIKNMGKTIHLGIWNNKEQAHEIYLQAKRKLHEGCVI